MLSPVARRWGFLWWPAYIVREFSLLDSFSRSQMCPPLRVRMIFSFILVYARYPSSTCRVDLPRTGICHISLISKWLEMIHKA